MPRVKILLTMSIARRQIPVVPLCLGGPGHGPLTAQVLRAGQQLFFHSRGGAWCAVGPSGRCVDCTKKLLFLPSGAGWIPEALRCTFVPSCVCDRGISACQPLYRGLPLS